MPAEGAQDQHPCWQPPVKQEPSEVPHERHGRNPRAFGPGRTSTTMRVGFAMAGVLPTDWTRGLDPRTGPADWTRGLAAAGSADGDGENVQGRIPRAWHGNTHVRKDDLFYLSHGLQRKGRIEDAACGGYTSIALVAIGRVDHHARGFRRGATARPVRCADRELLGGAIGVNYLSCAAGRPPSGSHQERQYLP
jgi:hypothetical protein